jgi:hypothetical protein
MAEDDEKNAFIVSCLLLLLLPLLPRNRLFCCHARWEAMLDWKQWQKGILAVEMMTD